MDITFKTDIGRFNYRVASIIIHDNHLLVMKDERSPYYYLPGGRVSMHETAEEAILREIKEELEIKVNIVRPLWFNQSFFIEDVDHDKYHELCLYYLIDITGTALLGMGKEFELTEDGKHHHMFRWIPFNEIEDIYIYPEFIKQKVFDLPEHLDVLVTYE